MRNKFQNIHIFKILSKYNLIILQFSWFLMDYIYKSVSKWHQNWAIIYKLWKIHKNCKIKDLHANSDRNTDKTISILNLLQMLVICVLFSTSKKPKNARGNRQKRRKSRNPTNYTTIILQPYACSVCSCCNLGLWHAKD